MKIQVEISWGGQSTSDHPDIDIDVWAHVGVDLGVCDDVAAILVESATPILIIWWWPSWHWCWCMGWCWGWSWCWWWCWCCSCWKCHSHPHNLVVTILEWKVDTAQGDLHRQTTYIALFHISRISFVDICSYFWQVGHSYFPIIIEQQI